MAWQAAKMKGKGLTKGNKKKEGGWVQSKEGIGAVDKAIRKEEDAIKRFIVRIGSMQDH